MYNLEGGVIWTQELKNAFKTGTTYCSVIHNQQEYNESNFLKEAELKDVKYVPNAGFIGQAISKMLTIKMVNDEESNLNFENANVQFKIGAKYNDIIYYINYGNFIVNEPPENDDTNGTVKFIAYDYMIKFNQNYTNRVSYPCKLKDLLLDICNQAGVELGSTTFQNEDFEVEDNQFEGKQLRDVLQHIAKCAFSWARIGQDNKLYLDFEVNNDIDEIITIDDYKMDAFKKANEYYGPINKVTYADSDIKGQEISVPDDASIATYGEKEIIIYDNYFAYNKEKRKELIQAGTALFGLRYMPVQNLELIGLVYLDCTDIIGVQDGAGTTYLTRVFSHIIKYNGAVSDTIETTGESDNEKKYSNPNNSIAQNSRTEIIVDRAKKEITAVVEEVAGQNRKIAKVKETVDELNSKISDIADITTSLESNSARLEFENINQSEPVRVVIHPVGTNIAKLHPSTSLKPSTNLTIKTRILRFTNTTTEEVFEYELPDDLLYYDSENYDEFILDYDSLSCVINKKCKWNNDGTVGLLPSERAVEYEFPHIELTDGDYTVELIQYNSGYLFARLMAQNIYTTQFATKAELNSEISQTTQGINLSVDKKLSNYSTTSQMNSAIDLKANQITQTVSETYVTNQTLQDNYSTTQQTSGMISATVSSMTKNNLETVTVEYALGTDTETAPSSGWSTTAPPWQQGKYMWQRTKTKTADGTESISNPTCIAGAKGQDGTNGVSISSITEYYAVSSSNSSAPADSAFKTTMQTMTATNKYLWNYEVITYSNNNTQKTIKRVIGTYGDKGTDGTNGIGIKSVTNKYQVSTSNTTAPTSWSDTPQTMTATNKYLWNYEIITYSDNTTSTSTPAVIGTYGDKGNTGDTGKGVKGVVTEYYLSNSESTQSGGSWTTTQPTYKENHYYWTRTKITWTDDTVTYTTPILVEEINSLNKSVASLTIEAGKIKQRVDAIEDLTNEANGTKTVTLTNCVKGSVLELHIYGNNSVFQAMYPNDTLYPQDNLYPKGDSLITVKYANNTTKTYELGVTEVLRKNGSVYDEYILESGQAQVIRRINSNGTVKTTPTTQNLGEFSIALEEGTNTITIKNYSADMYVKYAIKSAYTDIFATQVQMNSSITQTAQEINLEVSKKVDSNEVISKINQSAEAVGINANKINLSANDVLNLLSGNTINLSGKSIKIASNNFSVNENGKMTCSNANITGGQFNVTSTSTNTDTLRITNVRDSNEYMYASPGMIQLKTSKGRSFMTVRSDSSDHSYLSLENDVSGNGITITEDGIICQNIYYNQTTSNVPNMQIGSDGTFRRSTNTSTQRYKTEIKDVEDEVLNPEKLYDLKIKQFKYKKEYQPNEKDFRYDKTLVGFIAEDVSKIYPIATDYDDNGNIENWNERYIIPPMLKLIQEQHIEINQMKEEIEKLRKEIEK